MSFFQADGQKSINYLKKKFVYNSTAGKFERRLGPKESQAWTLFGAEGLGFGAEGSGFRVQGLGLRVQVQGFGLRVQGSGFRA